MNAIFTKLKEVLLSVLPIIVLVTILNFTIAPIGTPLLIRFYIGAAFVMCGLTLFLLGIDIGITMFGKTLGSSLAKSNKLWIVLILGLIIGFFVSAAEPALQVFAGQVDTITSGQISGTALLIFVSIGIGVVLILGLIRIFYNFSLRIMLIILYIIILVIALFSSKEFLAIAFDAGGAVTGLLVVPFVLTLSIGAAQKKKDASGSQSDIFGLLAIVITGAVISVMILGLISKNVAFDSGGVGGMVEDSDSIMGSLVKIMPDMLLKSFIAILPLLVILLVLYKPFLKLNKKKLRKMLTGFAFAFLGMFLFLVGINGAFMDIGIKIGYLLASMDNIAYLAIIGFVLGAAIILAEPSVYVLTHQIEDVTTGYVKRKAVLITLTIGVGLAVLLSVLRIIVPTIQLWHYLLPGYFICLLLMFFVPKLFVGISFDSGVVATGPMTTTFIFAFIQGAALAYEGANVMNDGFGMIALVSLLPVLTLEVLGLMYTIALKKKGAKKKHE